MIYKATIIMDNIKRYSYYETSINRNKIYTIYIGTHHNLQSCTIILYNGYLCTNQNNSF